MEVGKILRNVYPPVTAEPWAFAWGPLGSLSRAGGAATCAPGDRLLMGTDRGPGAQGLSARVQGGPQHVAGAAARPTAGKALPRHVEG